MSSSNYRAVVRLAGFDLQGNIKVGYALPRVRGVGFPYSNAVLRALAIDPNIPLGSLSEEEVNKIESALRSPADYGIPGWILNRQNDPYSGSSLHVIGPDLLMLIRKDVETMIRMKNWKGVRHSLGLKVRGQRTRATGRLGQAVGVKRKALAQATAAAKPQEAK
ncbi:MAG: 30S ribosomal protein S13 [Candidatus Marsarchaeota archaeon]|nr:30S ribosomal protein S13 [Candidatus Marsarchaeota archaeon]